jgi:biopolymer transport protein ExbD
MAMVDMGAKGASKRRGRIINDLTPMVDIAFLLVIFFMTTTVFREPQAIEISLPPKGSVPTAQSNVITILIDSLGQTTYQMADSAAIPIVLDSIETFLRAEDRKNAERQFRGPEFLAQLDALKPGTKQYDSLERFIKRKVSKLTILIDVHQKSLYQQMVKVMDQVQQARMMRFSIIPHVEEKTPAKKPRAGGR